MPAYAIAYTGEFTDEAALQEYRRRNTDVVAQFGGRFVVRGGAVDVLEGDWPWERAVVMEFPDAEAARAWYRSPEYEPLRELRQGASRTQLVVVEGV
jgi:uncharacterized protein (DUF1330 family)